MPCGVCRGLCVSLSLLSHPLNNLSLLAKELMKEDFILKNPAWIKEIEIMVKTKKKAEIQALSSFGFQYVTEVYLPRKLREGDWI